MCVGVMGFLPECPTPSAFREGWGLGFPCWVLLPLWGRSSEAGRFPTYSQDNRLREALNGVRKVRNSYPPPTPHLKKTARPQGRATHQSRNLTEPLKFHSPKLRRRMHQLQPQLPTTPSLMPAPDQYRFRFSLIASILDPHLLPHRKSLRYYRQASLRADIHRIALCLVGRPAFRPLHSHLQPRVHPRTCSHILQHPERIVHFVRSVHVHSSCHNLTHHHQFLTLESPRALVNGTSLPNSPISHHPNHHLGTAAASRRFCTFSPPPISTQPPSTSK